MSLLVEAYTGRPTKQRGHRALQREVLTQSLSKEERVMALDPVSGHHSFNNLAGSPERFLCHDEPYPNIKQFRSVVRLYSAASTPIPQELWCLCGRYELCRAWHNALSS